jgi:hypothetical protein
MIEQQTARVLANRSKVFLAIARSRETKSSEKRAKHFEFGVAITQAHVAPHGGVQRPEPLDIAQTGGEKSYDLFRHFAPESITRLDYLP